MAMQPWLYTVLAIIGGFHLLIVLYMWSRLSFAEDQASRARSDRSADSTEVTCPECGTTNERAYRFCGKCVAELPGGVNSIEHLQRPLGVR